ncbi:MAG: hypothetical protein ACPGVU_06565 [Limisphaerales bacterium]
MEHLVSGLIGDIVGGLIVLVGFAIVLKKMFRSNPENILSLSVERYDPYRDIELLTPEK